MRKVIAYIILCTLSVQLWAETPYQKFRSGKDLEERSSVMTIFRQKDKILLEIPDSLVGRRVLLNSYIRSSSTSSVSVGTDISASEAYKIGKTDSLILFLRPSLPVVAGDATMEEALRYSGADAIAVALPIKYRNADSTAFVVEADKLLDPSDKKVADLKGQTYSDNAVSSSTFKKDLSVLKGISAYPGSVGVLRALTYDLKLRGMLGELAGSYKFSGDVETCLTLLPESTVAPLRADERIGTMSVRRPVIDSGSQGYRLQDWVSRWNLSGGRKIDVYVDTLLTAPWCDAVSDGLLEWNRAFREAGLGDRITVQPFPKEGFNAFNPLVNTVMVGAGSSIGARITRDPQSGEILSFSITIPDDFASAARREGSVYISEVDPRWRSYDVPSDAVAEVLKAQTMTVFGQCLGLARNFAGSFAYSPGQLRDAAFTREHGITSSVTDAVIFNILARPGDREKGVATVVSRTGAYDSYAIRWIYDDSLDREAWLQSHYGQPEYLYLPVTRLNPDPRALSVDLGNDPFEAANTLLQRMKWLSEHAIEWVDAEGVEQDYKDLFADYIFLGVDRAAAILSAQVGGIMADNRSTPKYRTVPAEKQKEALSLIIDTWKNLDWMDDKKDLLHLAGANRDVSASARLFGWTQSRLHPRFEFLAMSEELVPGSYTLEAALQDIEDALLKDIRCCKAIAPGEDTMIAQYVLSLYSRSPIMTAQVKGATESGLSLSVYPVPAVYTRETEAACYNAIIRFRKSLRAVRRRQDKAGRAKIDFILGTIDHALNQN